MRAKRSSHIWLQPEIIAACLIRTKWASAMISKSTRRPQTAICWSQRWLVTLQSRVSSNASLTRSLSAAWSRAANPLNIMVRAWEKTTSRRWSKFKSADRKKHTKQSREKKQNRNIWSFTDRSFLLQNTNVGLRRINWIFGYSFVSKDFSKKASRLAYCAVV